MYSYQKGYTGNQWIYSGVQPADVQAWYANVGVSFPPFDATGNIDYAKRNSMVEKYIEEFLHGTPAGYEVYTGYRQTVQQQSVPVPIATGEAAPVVQPVEVPLSIAIPDIELPAVETIENSPSFFQNQTSFQSAGSSAPDVMLPAPSEVVEIFENANQGVPSISPVTQEPIAPAPWDAQPDIAPVAVPVEGKAPAIYVGSNAEIYNDPKFTDWLHLQVPDVAEYNALINDEKLIAEYHEQFLKETRVVRNTLSDLPGQRLPFIPEPDPVIIVTQPETGGMLQPAIDYNDMQQNQFLPDMLTPNVPISITENDLDYVAFMLSRNASDFLNILATQYESTLKQIASNPDARKQFNQIIAANPAGGKIELFLRNYIPEKKVEKTVETVIPKTQSNVWQYVFIIGAIVAVVFAAGSFGGTNAN